MAIVIEEERRQSVNPIGILIWATLLIAIGAGIYYLFFAKPELVEYVAPASFRSTEQISRVAIDPEGIMGDARFRALRQYVTLPEGTVFGRENPFSGFGLQGVPPAAPPAR